MVRFQVLDARVYREGAGDQTKKRQDCIQLFGVDATGRDVCATLHGWRIVVYLRGDAPRVSDETVRSVLVQASKEIKRRFVPVSVRAVRRRQLLNYQGGKEYDYYRVELEHSGDVYALRDLVKSFRKGGKTRFTLSVLGGTQLEVYHTGLDQLLRHFHESASVPCGWVSLPEEFELPAGVPRLSRCVVEYRAPWGMLVPLPSEESVAPFVLLSYDIETYSVDGTFPQPTRPGDVITQIGSSWMRWGSSEIYKRVDVLGRACDPVEGVEIACHADETHLLLGWRQWVIDVCRPDVMTAYNNWMFDDQYLWKRAERLGILEQFSDMSKLVGQSCKLFSKKGGSKQRGDSELELVDLIGIVNIDLMQLLKVDYKLESYSLRSVSAHFLENQNKEDLSAPEMFKLFEEGAPAGLAKIASYCAQDTALLLHLVKRLEKINQYVEMARVCLVPLKYLFQKGQQVKVRGAVSIWVCVRVFIRQGGGRLSQCRGPPR